jgi:hypothetical protein
MNEVNAQQKSAKQPIIITQNYGFIADKMQYTLYERHTVDPTKGPNWARDNAKAIAETGVGLSTETREEWRSFEKYFPMTPDGFTAMILGATVRDVNDATEARHFTELLAEYRAENARLSAQISHAMLPRFDRDSDAPVASE